MGYKHQAKIYKFKFDDSDPDYEGLEVRLKSLPMKDFLKISKMQGTDHSEEELDEVISLLVKSIVSWNVEDANDEPLPVSEENLLEVFDLTFVLFLITRWMEQMSDVEPNLKRASPSTAHSQVAQLPMVPLSESHAS